MRRRAFLTFRAASAFGPPLAHARDQRIFSVVAPVADRRETATPRVGILFPGIRARSPQLTTLWEGLRSFGYVEGKNIAFDLRASEGSNEKLPALAAELVDSHPDVIVGITT